VKNEFVETVIVGGGQAGLAMSEQLSLRGLPHLVLERHRIAERWRSERWDGLHANGPVATDRIPGHEFQGFDPDDFATRDQMVAYFTEYARAIAAPVRGDTLVTTLSRRQGGGFVVETPSGSIEARNVIAATGPFQRPNVPAIVPADAGIFQVHSSAYRNPEQLPAGAVLVVGSGASGAQIADELLRAGRRVYLSLSRHARPPRRYRGRDYVWWMYDLGMWDAQGGYPPPRHIPLAVSGAYGGQTVDFRRVAADGATLMGRTQGYQAGVLRFADDLAENLAKGDESYQSFLDAADAVNDRDGLGLPEEPDAHVVLPDPDSVTHPILELPAQQISAIVWATGYGLDFGWVQLPVFDGLGRPVHDKGVTDTPGFYFLGLSFLSRRASAFVFGVQTDAIRLADHIAGRS
jgi:putative flavoprotein involved in K+ transport